MASKIAKISMVSKMAAKYNNDILIVKFRMQKDFFSIILIFKLNRHCHVIIPCKKAR